MPKNKIINFKVEGKVKAEFETLCEENCTSVSHELRLFVHQYIKRQASKTTRIILNHKQ